MLPLRTGVLVALTVACGVATTAAQRPGGSATPMEAITRAVSRDIVVRAIRAVGVVRATIDSRTGQLEPKGEPIEVLVLLPDQFVRREQRNGFDRTDGFSGQTPLIAYHSRSGGPAPMTRVGSDAVPTQRATLARLLLGMIGTTGGVVEVSSSRATTPVTVHITGTKPFECDVILDSLTRVPVEVRYQQPAPFYSHTQGANEPKNAFRVEMAEAVVTFEDRRVVGGIAFPHSISIRATSPTTKETTPLEELKFQSVEINPNLSVDEFRKAGESGPRAPKE